MLWRALFDALATAFFVAALVHMKIAELSAVVLTSPLILTALAAFAFRTVWAGDAGPRSALALLGTLFIVKPGAGTFDVWALVGLAAASSRRFATSPPGASSHRSRSLAVRFYGAFAVMLRGRRSGSPKAGSCPNLEQWAGVAIASAVPRSWDLSDRAGLPQRGHPAVAPFRYTLLIWMGIAGYFAFGEVPDRWAWVGAALIALSGLYALAPGERPAGASFRPQRPCRPGL